MVDKRRRVLTGDRPTGPLHLGHYVGSLINRLRLQEECEGFFMVSEMVVSRPRLERIPSLKEMARAANLDVFPFGLLGYPVLQAADILLPRADLVPGGKDNEAHIEIEREIARRFN